MRFFYTSVHFKLMDPYMLINGQMLHVELELLAQTEDFNWNLGNVA